MRNPFVWFGLLSIGCGDFGDADDDELTQDEFVAEYEARYCEKYAACNTTSRECPAAQQTTTTGEPVECPFDPVAAEDCLDGTWVCNVDFPGLEYVIPPEACLEVCGPGAATSDPT